MSSNNRQVHVLVQGHVQGVGFRNATRTTARQFSLTGWVRNTRDNNVEVVAVGSQLALEQFVIWLRMGHPTPMLRILMLLGRIILKHSSHLR